MQKGKVPAKQGSYVIVDGKNVSMELAQHGMAQVVVYNWSEATISRSF